MKIFSTLSGVALVVALGAGCNGGGSTADDGSVDALVDGHVGSDMAIAPDLGMGDAGTDTGVMADLGTDTGVADDLGTDTGVADDLGTMDDLGMDSAVDDLGTDAGPPDMGAADMGPPCTPTPLSCATTMVSGMTSFPSLVTTWGDCSAGDGYDRDDALFTFQTGTTGRMAVTIASTETTTTTDYDLFAVAAGASTCDASGRCADESRGGTGNETITFGATATQSFLVGYDRYASAVGPTVAFSLSITCVPVVCGNGTLGPGEGCDDGNTADGDGCSSTCDVERGYVCDGGEPSACRMTVCGDGVIEGAEVCDDGNAVSADGCSSTCTIETGYLCFGEPSACNLLVCGDGRIQGAEVCDDGNVASSDGCSSTCTVEAGYGCTGEPSVCTLLPYTETSIAAACEDLSTGATELAVVEDDDAASPFAALPFPLTFFGMPMNDFSMGSNGLIQLAVDATGFPSTSGGNDPIPTMFSTENYIAPLWDDLLGTPGTSIARYETFGTGPNRHVTFEWNDFAIFSHGAAQLTFQVKLFETTNVIELHYCTLVDDPTSVGRSFGNSATVGLENSDGTAGIQHSYDMATLSTTSAIRFTPVP